MNQEPVSSIFQLMRRRLRALGNALLKNDADVDDAIQDTFCRVWSHRDRIDECGNAGAFVFTTMRNVCIDTIRSRQCITPVDNIADDIDDPYPETDIYDMYADVIEIINRQLSDTQRQILRMRDIEGRTYSDIAAILCMEEATVRVNLSRARKTVRNIYRRKNE